MKNFKRKVVLLVASILVMAAAMTAFASPTPRWSYIGGIQGVLEISNGNADVEVFCDATTTGVNKVKAKCELQQLDGSWKTIKTWTETESGTSVHYYKSYPVSESYSYRLKITGYAYNGTTLLESATVYFN